MPSLNLRNVLRRNPDRPTLRERAASLKATAAKVIRQPKLDRADAAPPPAVAEPVDFLSPPPGFVATLSGGIPHFVQVAHGIQWEAQRLYATASRELARRMRALPDDVPEEERCAAEEKARRELRLEALHRVAFGPVDRRGDNVALKPSAGVDEEQGLAQACIDMAERLDWLDQNENVSGFSEEVWDAEFNRQGAVFRRAIDEPSADASDLAAKARLALSDLDRFKPADRFQGDGDRLMRVVLREAMALGGKSGSNNEGATDEGTPEIARIIEGPAASLPILDLSSCSIPQIARLYEVLHATYDHLSALGQLSCFWENGADASRVRFNPAGDIVDREADRLAELFGACAEEIARRKPRSARDSGEILLTRVMHELTCNGCIDDPALLRDVTTAWGA